MKNDDLNGRMAYVMNNIYQKFVKRAFDLFLSVLVLFLIWPVFLIIAFFIKATSAGPIIFKQKRIGQNGKVFTLYKFRTMVKGADQLKKKYLYLNEANGPVFKIKNDPRFINGLGKFLARSGLDELLNIFNVLQGKISWVGPRPLPVYEAKKIDPKIRKIRESVLPGITSSWVISGAHNLSFKQWMKLDREYIRKISLTQDLKIVLKTLNLSLNLIKTSLLNKVNPSSVDQGRK